MQSLKNILQNNIASNEWIGNKPLDNLADHKVFILLEISK
jgi:hypothetical protein